uniref:PIN domain-containing protein n=1 Tax=Setaria digitata TaxID=48799 RepID=A0A915PPY0_9BILA
MGDVSKIYKLFYFNVETKQTTWEMPLIEKPLTESVTVSDLPTKQTDRKHQQENSTIVKNRWLVSLASTEQWHAKKSVFSDDTSSRRSLSEWKIDTRRGFDKFGCLHGIGVPNTSESNEELMEIDEISMDEINRHEEPMEIDFVVGEVQAFRREHFLHPDLFVDDTAPFFHARRYTEACKRTENAGMILIVFDTSCLLQDTALLPMCIQRLCCSVIPYTVLKELDGLKKAKSDELRLKAVKTIAYLHDYIKRGCNYLFIENTFEASNGMEEFGCRNNDDIILKCAFVTTKKCKLLSLVSDKNEPVYVVFATNDKNLAVKAAVHNIVTADRNELLNLITTDPSKNKEQQFMTEVTVQKMSPSDFSFTITDKPSSSITETAMQVTTPEEVVDYLPALFGYRSSSPSFTFVPKKEDLSLYNASFPLAKDNGKFKKEFCDFLEHKRGIRGARSLTEHHGTREMPYSIQKAGRGEEIGSSRSCKKRKLCELSGRSMNDFLEIFARLVQYLLSRNDRKSFEDMKRLNKVIGSVIANESSSLSVLVDMVSKFYDFYADRDVFISATHFDKKQLINEYESTASTVKEKLGAFQKQLLGIKSHIA